MLFRKALVTIGLSAVVGAASLGLMSALSRTTYASDRGVRLYYEGTATEVDLIDGGIALAIALLRQGGNANPDTTQIQTQANAILQGTGLTVQASDITGTPNQDPLSVSDFDGNGTPGELVDAVLLLAQALLIQGGNANPNQAAIITQADALLQGTGLPTPTIADGADRAGSGAPPFGEEAIALSAPVPAGLAGEIRIEVAANENLPAPGQGFTLPSAEAGAEPARFVRIITLELEGQDTAIFAAALENDKATALNLDTTVPENDKPSAFKRIAGFESVSIPGVEAGGSKIRVVQNGTAPNTPPLAEAN
ncbi:MAG: hypothetical protein AAFX40_06530 [Cyanobacteria bacterium J06639_1]